MDLALALLLLWGLLFVPLGLVLHWLVLGEGSSVRALPIAPVTGIAVAVLVLAALGRLGIDAGEQWIPWAFIAVSLACVLVAWRRTVPWRSRELVGAGLLLLLAVVLIQMPVVGGPGDGPLGYGTVVDPVGEVAAIDAAADGPAGDLAIAREAAATSDERAIGFEQFAALTVAIGLDQDADTIDATWTAYGLHAAITGMLAALITLPLFAFARARGVRWFGLLVLVPLGVIAPAVFLALANGEGAAVASVPFTTAAVFSLLVTRRDRGWWTLVVLYGAAASAVAGPTALLPLVAVGVAWMLLRSDTYEHLSQHDAPVSTLRSLVVTGVAAGLGAIAAIPLVVSGGEQLSWSPLHERLGDAIRSWPFAWLDSDLAVRGPSGALETAIWLIGPALLAVAVIYAIVRNERRELGVLVGAIVAAVLAALVGLVEERAGIRLFEFTMLSLSPFLAALAIRAVALARENAEDPEQGRLAGTGPTVLVVAFVVLSLAATTVTGTRMVHAPEVIVASGSASPGSEGERSQSTAIIAAGDPWLAFVVDGELVRGGYADADAISDERNRYADHGLVVTGYDQVVLSSSPLSSDPPLRYLEQSTLDDYQVRLFLDRNDLENPPVRDRIVDEALEIQRARSETADRPGTDSAEATAPQPDAQQTVRLPNRHTPVEGDGPGTPADRPAGLLLPPGDVVGCDSTRSDTSSCEPAEPLVGDGCRDDDLTAARAHDDRDRAQELDEPTGRAQVLGIDPDPQLPARPTMLGLQCLEVPLDDDSDVLLVHLRDVGMVLPPEQATTTGDWELERQEGRSGGNEGVGGGTTRVTSELDASLTFGAGRLGGGLQYDLVLEGEFGAGVDVSTGLAPLQDDSGEPDVIPGAELGSLRGSADGFSSILRRVPLSGAVTVTNAAGTDVAIGRLFARPRDLPRSCDVPVPLAAGEQREVRVELPAADGGGTAQRPGLVVTMLGIDESGDERVARLAVATYLSRFGLPRYTLVDWTEQYEDDVTVEGCDGVTFTEDGPDRPAEQATITEQSLRETFGGGEPDGGVEVPRDVEPFDAPD